MHAGQQPAVGVAPAVEFGRSAARPDEGLERRILQVVRQPRRSVERRLGVDICPARVVVIDDVKDLVARLDGLERGVAEGAGKLPGHGRVLSHRDNELWFASGRGLNDHGGPLTYRCHQYCLGFPQITSPKHRKR